MKLPTLERIILLATLAATVGCSSDSGKATLSGSVTLDGEPLKNGVIRFVPLDGQTPTAEATIAEGQFNVEVPLGEKRVSISAPKVVGKRPMYQTPDSPTIDIVEELLPARYNLRSELTINVEEDNEPGNFTLMSR